MPTTRKSVSKATRSDDIAQLHSQVADADMRSRQAEDLTDEISQLLWAVSGLDPEAEHLLKHSDYVANLAARTPD
ncbi:hypothetical protein [Microvirga sp. VF16]|uniref:hypothetical protein n=1 Tax=Microvirga sp. VF16 TaxID=2807101 RepID=UPI00193CAAD1|nr:hypothetical protein [Microvirga sp. VF16]QRM32915.1 hypothetical protein JO965_26595 [Microvirga sp. VF16]